jgi:hypothetical protein
MNHGTIYLKFMEEKISLAFQLRYHKILHLSKNKRKDNPMVVKINKWKKTVENTI